MAISKLHSINFFIPQTPLRAHTSPSQQLSLRPSAHAPPPLSLQPKAPFLFRTTVPKHPLETHFLEDTECSFRRWNIHDDLSVAFPSLGFANTLFFNSGYNVQVIVRDDEPEDRLIGRFRREVLKAGVLQESKRRRWFETTQEKRKRKTREAARRNRKRRPLSKALQKVNEEAPKKKDDSDDDNWEFLDVDPPYCCFT